MDIAIRELALELGDAGGGDSGKSPMPAAARAAAEPNVGQRRAAAGDLSDAHVGDLGSIGELNRGQRRAGAGDLDDAIVGDTSARADVEVGQPRAGAGDL